MKKQLNYAFLFILLTTSLSLQAAKIKTAFVGEYVLKKTAISGYLFSGDPLEFGIFNIILEDETKVPVPDLLYPVGENRLGIRIIPVSDKDENGSEIADQFLKKVLYGDVNSNKDIFSLLVYNHPEINSAKFDMLNEALRTEMGMTHAGAYIGLGRAKNAPVDYHSRGWEVFESGAHGYPAHIYTVGLKGVDQEVINQNILIALRILNGWHGGPEFPDDYKFDYFRTYNLKEVLDFYRAWIDPEFAREDINKRLKIDLKTPYIKLLKEHQGFMTYCNEHLTIALNLGVNLVQTEQGYIDVWGKKLGTDLFLKAKKIYHDVTKVDFERDKVGKISGIPEDLLKSFNKNPLWKRRLSKKEQESPLYNSSKVKEFGFSLAWKPETTADIIADFVRVYADFTKITVVRSSFAILSFAKEVYRRLGLHPDEYNSFALKFIQKMIKHDIRYQATKPQGGVVISKLPSGHPGRSIFEERYFEKVEAGFFMLTKGQSKMEKGIVLAKKGIVGLTVKLKELEEKLKDDKDSKTLTDNIFKTKEKIKDLELTVVTLGSQINLIPLFIEMLTYVKSTTQHLIEKPLEMISKDQVSRETTKMLTANIKHKKLTSLTLEEQAWLAFAVDVNKVSKHKAGGKDVVMSLMDIARNIKPATPFEGQFEEGTKYVEFYSPPAIIHKIALGMYIGVDPDFEITAVGTAFDKVEVEKKK